MELHALVDRVNGWVWGMPLVLLCLGTGVLFSLWTRFLQVRHLKAMVKQLWQGAGLRQRHQQFSRGFAMALGGRVGTGNIAGVATAIAMGGPGALFWMWAIAFLGAGSAFIEAALAQVWKEKVDGEYRGGPSYYIERGPGHALVRHPLRRRHRAELRPAPAGHPVQQQSPPPVRAPWAFPPGLREW